MPGHPAFGRPSALRNLPQTHAHSQTPKLLPNGFAAAASWPSGFLQSRPRSRPIGSSGPGLFDLPPELRNSIYSYVFVEVDWLRVAPGENAETGSELSHRAFHSCEFLRTCRQIYDEASPIFWGMHVFRFHAEPSVFAPTARDPYDLDNLGSWITRSGIRSVRCRRKVRNLTIDVWNPTATRYARGSGSDNEVDWWKMDCVRDPSKAGLDGLEGVKSLGLEFDFWNANLSAIPELEEVPTLTILEYPEQDQGAMLRLKAAKTVKRSVLVTLQYLLPKLQNIERIILSRPPDPPNDGLPRFGCPITPFEPSSKFIRQVRRLAAQYGCALDFDTAPGFGAFCSLCFCDWTPTHWSPRNPSGYCPELDNISADTFYYGPDDFFNQWKDYAAGRACVSTRALLAVSGSSSHS